MILIVEDEPVYIGGRPITFSPRGEEEDGWVARRVELGHANAQWDDAAIRVPSAEALP